MSETNVESSVQGGSFNLLPRPGSWMGNTSTADGKLLAQLRKISAPPPAYGKQNRLSFACGFGLRPANQGEVIRSSLFVGSVISLTFVSTLYIAHCSGGLQGSLVIVNHPRERTRPTEYLPPAGEFNNVFLEFESLEGVREPLRLAWSPPAKTITTRGIQNTVITPLSSDDTEFSYGSSGRTTRSAHA